MPSGSTTLTTEPAAFIARLTGMTDVRIRVAARLVTALAAIILTGCGTLGAPVITTSRSTPARGSDVTGPIRQPGSFLTVTTSAPVFHAGQVPSLGRARFPVSRLQLRSARDGRVIATLLRSNASIDAVMTRSGSVIAVEDFGCRSQIVRINPRTGRATRLRVLAGSVNHIALSPDGRELAYLTYSSSNPRTCGPVRLPAAPLSARVSPGDPIQFLPNVVAVTGLLSGAIVQGATSNPGQPVTAPAWSPDGTRIAVTFTADHSIVLLSARHPDFASAPRIRPARGCRYLATTWTVAGLVAAAGCGQNESDQSPQMLVRISPIGQRLASWRLPACVADVQAFTDPAGRHVLVEDDLGYSSGPPCGIQQPGGSSIRVAVVRGRTLASIATFTQQSAQLQVTGW